MTNAWPGWSSPRHWQPRRTWDRSRKRRRKALAAARLADDQGPDGSWPLEGEDSVSSPATYGRLLATFMARQALASIQPERFRTAIARADRWLLDQEIVTVTDASVSLLLCARVQSPAARARRDRGLALLRRGQDEDGGWGPRTLSPSESFDTALALLALAACPSSDLVNGMIARGRAFLIAEQLNDGSWVETTRPLGNVSYAQRISTCGWATMVRSWPLASTSASGQRAGGPISKRQ